MWYKCISNINGTLPGTLARHPQNEHVRNKRRVSTTGDHQAPRPFMQSDSSASLVADWAMRTYHHNWQEEHTQKISKDWEILQCRATGMLQLLVDRGRSSNWDWQIKQQRK